MSIEGLLRFGSDHEDSRQAIQALYHFVDPANGNAALSVRVKGSDATKAIGKPSPDWILEDKGDVVDFLGKPNPFSYKKARGYFFKALSEPNKTERDKSWGLAFQSLGHVIHHLQDMAQPQHTRNDAHCFELVCGVGNLIFQDVYKAAQYENFTQAYPGSFDGYAPVYSKAKDNGMRTPRHFWQTAAVGAPATGKGIAEFSNVNFVTDGTNFHTENSVPKKHPRYALPEPGAQKAETIAALFAANGVPAKLNQLCNSKPETCYVTMVSTRGTDHLTNETFVNERASTLSLFDGALEKYGSTVQIVDPSTGEGWSTEKVFSMNSFNYERMRDLLLKRAVGYSAGMINYFFRGDIDLVEDAEMPGTYLIKNLGNEPLAGTFGLYFDDSSDNRALHKSWDLAIPAGGQANIGAIDIPVSAVLKTPGEYMLVFNGDMGEETRAVYGVGAVSARAVNLTKELLLLSERVLFVSVDQGATWRVRYSTGDPGFNALNWIGGKTLISNNQISTDIGKTWTYLDRDPMAQICRLGGASNGNGKLFASFIRSEDKALTSPDFMHVRLLTGDEDGTNCVDGGYIPMWGGIGKAIPLGGGRFVANALRMVDNAGTDCLPGFVCDGRRFLSGIQLSSDGGRNWVLQSDSQQMWRYVGKTTIRDGSVQVDATGLDTIISVTKLGGAEETRVISVSQDYGRTWTRLGAPPELALNDSPNHYGLEQLVYAGGGVVFALVVQDGLRAAYLYRSPDFGATWVRAGPIPNIARSRGVNAIEFISPGGFVPGYE